MENNIVKQKIPKRILNSLVSSVSAGVVPRSGAPYIAIGRKDEIEAFLSDMETVNDGGSAMRFLIGRYGSGKSFLIQLVRGYALERNFLTADCDLSPERRLYGTSGTGLATYRELIRNLASKTCPDGGAVTSVLANWIFTLKSELADAGISPDSPNFENAIEGKIRATMKELEFFVGGFDFAKIIRTYYIASESGDEEKASACLRWLRGEYSGKTEAKRALGFDVSVVVGDDNWYDFLKLWAELSAKTGYRGLCVFIDECVNLYKIPNRISRENNYEKILSMFNDTLQGKARHLSIVFGGTPQFLEDQRRGLFSYDALRSRLSGGRFAESGFKNMLGPVIRLVRLSDDELLALIVRMTYLHAVCYSWQPPVTSENQIDFLKKSLKRAGADTMITPREMLRDYMTLLNIMLQNPGKSYEDIVADIAPDTNPANGQNVSEEEIPEQSENTSADVSKPEKDKKYFNPEDLVF